MLTSCMCFGFLLDSDISKKILFVQKNTLRCLSVYINSESELFLYLLSMGIYNKQNLPVREIQMCSSLCGKKHMHSNEVCCL